MGRVHIAALVLDEGNISEIARHAVSAREVEQVVFNRYITGSESTRLGRRHPEREVAPCPSR